MDDPTPNPPAWVKRLVLASLILPPTAILCLWTLFEVSDVRPEWPLYYIGVPESVRDATPTFAECRPARFRWKGRDGEGVPYVAMDYGSYMDPDVALLKHTAAMAPLACRGEPAQVSGAGTHFRNMRCEHPDVWSAEISVEGGGPCREVTVSFVLND